MRIRQHVIYAPDHSSSCCCHPPTHVLPYSGATHALPSNTVHGSVMAPGAVAALVTSHMPNGLLVSAPAAQQPSVVKKMNCSWCGFLNIGRPSTAPSCRTCTRRATRHATQRSPLPPAPQLRQRHAPEPPLARGASRAPPGRPPPAAPTCAGARPAQLKRA